MIIIFIYFLKQRVIFEIIEVVNFNALIQILSFVELVIMPNLEIKSWSASSSFSLKHFVTNWVILLLALFQYLIKLFVSIQFDYRLQLWKHCIFILITLHKFVVSVGWCRTHLRPQSILLINKLIYLVQIIFILYTHIKCFVVWFV